MLRLTSKELLGILTSLQEGDYRRVRPGIGQFLIRKRGRAGSKGFFALDKVKREKMLFSYFIH